MATTRELMGDEIFSLIYVHHDRDGQMIEDFEDVIYCDDENIPHDRIEDLKALLKPVTNAKDTLIPIEAAKLLAAWGVPEAIKYFEYCIDSRIDRLGNLSPHRLHGYDTTYEEIERSVLHYYARCIDRSRVEGERAKALIQPILKKIIQLASEKPYDLSGLIKEIKDENWREYEPDLKACYTEIIKRRGDERITELYIAELEDLLKNWDPNFIKGT